MRPVPGEKLISKYMDSFVYQRETKNTLVYKFELQVNDVNTFTFIF